VLVILTRADFGGRPDKSTYATRRLRVHALFDAIQVAIDTGDVAQIDRLLVQLALATASRAQVN
jgi:hypothetical protein